MKSTLLIIYCLTYFVIHSVGQENKPRLKILNFHIGPNISNLINSEAPHKINIYGSDEYPALIDSYDISESLGYFDYETSLIKDSKIGITFGVGFEYYLKNGISICFSLNYETKGIDLKNSTSETYIKEFNGEYYGLESYNYEVVSVETFEVNISNNYLTLPFYVRKYLLKEKFHIQGGFYGGYLLTSKVNTYNEKSDDVNYFSTGMNNEIDTEKEFTTNFDFGVSLGAGFNYPINDNLFFKVDYLVNIGLRKIDKKYNNEYEEQDGLPSYPGFYSSTLRSTNYYGLNSNARNISMALTFGIGIKI